jgi:hypothetical protein
VNICIHEQGRVFILEHFVASKSFAAIHEAFSNAYPDKEILNKTTLTGNNILGQLIVTSAYQVTK